MTRHILFSDTNWNKKTVRVLLDRTGRLFFLLIFLLSLVGGTTTTVKAAGNVALDGTYSSGTADDVSSMSFAHATGIGTNRFMLVGVSWNCGTAGRSVDPAAHRVGI